jgi:hypothetical protein
MRSADELRPLAKQIAANAGLIRSFQRMWAKTMKTEHATSSMKSGITPIASILR